jgi:hypothetical protein
MIVTRLRYVVTESLRAQLDSMHKDMEQLQARDPYYFSRLALNFLKLPHFPSLLLNSQGDNAGKEKAHNALQVRGLPARCFVLAGSSLVF